MDGSVLGIDDGQLISPEGTPAGAYQSGLRPEPSLLGCGEVGTVAVDAFQQCLLGFRSLPFYFGSVRGMGFLLGFHCQF